MLVVRRSGYSPAGLAVVLVIHASIIYLVLRDRPAITNISPARYSRLLFILEPPLAPVVKTPEPVSLPKSVSTANRRRENLSASTPLAVTDAESKSAPIVTQAPQIEEPVRINIDSLIEQAGKADRETRSSKEMQAYGPAPDSMESVMTRAFTAAKLAVPLKWYEAARIELFSAPNDTKRIYQITTAFGTYCMFYPDYVKEPSGQPKLAACPERFGAGAK